MDHFFDRLIAKDFLKGGEIAQIGTIKFKFVKVIQNSQTGFLQGRIVIIIDIIISDDFYALLQ
ncbi:MAG: hypothetical protein BWX60_00419 [Candidatus Marinimicrobia bacterium ADurb.Bin030]|nr:MAG: hypothetical protein BWX60_00419 [Candidatus Marinimicrobia bacterium ADurb.Bin030]